MLSKEEFEEVKRNLQVGKFAKQRDLRFFTLGYLDGGKAHLLNEKEIASHVRLIEAACHIENKRETGADESPDRIYDALVTNVYLGLGHLLDEKLLNRKTIKYSKHVENLEALLAVFQTYYNYCLASEFSKTTPAIAAGVAMQRMTLLDLLLKSVK